MPNRVLLEAHEPRLFHDVLHVVPRRDPWRVVLHDVLHLRDELRARRAVGHAANFVVAKVEFFELKTCVVFATRLRGGAGQELQEILGVRVVSVPAFACHFAATFAGGFAHVGGLLRLDGKLDADGVHRFFPQLGELPFKLRCA